MTSHCKNEALTFITENIYFIALQSLVVIMFLTINSNPPLSYAIYFQERISEIKNNNAKVIQMQAVLRAHESKDRSLAERNFTKVNFWSVVNVIILLLVFGVQVFMIRSMFDDKRKVRT